MCLDSWLVSPPPSTRPALPSQLMYFSRNRLQPGETYERGVLFWREMLTEFDMFVCCFSHVTFCFTFCSKYWHKRNCVTYLHHVQAHFWPEKYPPSYIPEKSWCNFGEQSCTCQRTPTLIRIVEMRSEPGGCSGGWDNSPNFVLQTRPSIPQAT